MRAVITEINNTTLRFSLMNRGGKVINAEKNGSSFLGSTLHLMEREKANNRNWRARFYDIEDIPGDKVNTIGAFTISNINGPENEIVTYDTDGKLIVANFSANNRDHFWNITDISPGIFSITNFNNRNLTFTLKDGNTQSGTPIVVQNNNGDSNQTWHVSPEESEIKESYKYKQWVGVSNDIAYIISGVDFNIVTQGLLPYIKEYNIAINNSLITSNTVTELSSDIVRLNFDKPYVLYYGDWIKIGALDVLDKEVIILDRLIGSDPVGN